MEKYNNNIRSKILHVVANFCSKIDCSKNCNLIEHLELYPLDLGNCVDPSRKTPNNNLTKLNNNVGNSQVDRVKVLSSSPRT